MVPTPSVQWYSWDCLSLCKSNYSTSVLFNFFVIKADSLCCWFFLFPTKTFYLQYKQSWFSFCREGKQTPRLSLVQCCWFLSCLTDATVHVCGDHIHWPERVGLMAAYCKPQNSTANTRTHGYSGRLDNSNVLASFYFLIFIQIWFWKFTIRNRWWGPMRVEGGS